MDKLSRLTMDFVRENGAALAGIATVETLRGGPPSTDLSYVLEGARSAVTFAIPLKQDLIEPFLSKKDRLSHERDNILTNTLSSGVSLNLAKYLEQKGHPSAAVGVNNVYRPETPGGLFDMHPDLSHRYLAAASGLGWFGLSGNLITSEFGAAVILGTTVTTAELTPTPPKPAAESYCDGCRLCQASCASGLMDPQDETRVAMGGVEHAYSRRRTYLRCEFVCGGFTGLHPSGKWSTWSPGRFHIPDDDEAFRAAMIPGLKAYELWPEMAGGFRHVLMRRKLYLTCGHCQLLCHPDKAVRQSRYRLLTESGCVVQEADGSLTVTTADAARGRLADLTPERRSLYSNVS